MDVQPTLGVRRRSVLRFLLLLAIAFKECSTEPSKTYHMAELCERSPNSFPATYRKIDGAEVISRNDRNLDCVITFQTHSILQRFMLRFEVLNMDCNDHLYIFDGAHQTGAHKQDISCRNTKENLGTLFTRTNYITLKYVTDSWGTDNSFKLVITAIKDGKHSCKDFRCATKEFCIHPDLLCDSVNHCEDGSDEAFGPLCEAPVNDNLWGLTNEWIVVISICAILILLACGVGIGICVCRTRYDEKDSVNMTKIDRNNKHLNCYRPAVSGEEQTPTWDLSAAIAHVSFLSLRLSPHYTTKGGRGDPSLLPNNYLNDHNMNTHKEEWFV